MKGTLRDTSMGLQGDLEGELERDFQQDLRKSQNAVKLRSGKVWFNLQLKFNSLELDSEIGQLVSLCSPSYLESVESQVELIDLGAVKVEGINEGRQRGLETLDVLLRQPGLDPVHQLEQVLDGHASLGVLLGH